MDMALPGHLYAKSPLDQACWDIFGRSVGLPVYELLGGRQRDFVPCFATTGAAMGPEGLAEAAVKDIDLPTPIVIPHEHAALGMAHGYHQATGKTQAVMLHTGVGLLQGSMGIDAAQRAGIPMVVVSGEALTYGEQEGFHPGPDLLIDVSLCHVRFAQRCLGES